MVRPNIQNIGLLDLNDVIAYQIAVSHTNKEISRNIKTSKLFMFPQNILRDIYEKPNIHSKCIMEVDRPLR